MQLRIIIFVDANVVRRKCLARGFDVEFLDEKDWMFKLKHPKWTEFKENGIKVSRHMFGRVLAEFLNLDWFLNETMNISDFDPTFFMEANKA